MLNWHWPTKSMCNTQNNRQVVHYRPPISECENKWNKKKQKSIVLSSLIRSHQLTRYSHHVWGISRGCLDTLHRRTGCFPTTTGMPRRDMVINCNSREIHWASRTDGYKTAASSPATNWSKRSCDKICFYTVVSANTWKIFQLHTQFYNYSCVLLSCVALCVRGAEFYIALCHFIKTRNWKRIVNKSWGEKRTFHANTNTHTLGRGLN